MTVSALWMKHRSLARKIAGSYFIPGADRQDVQQEALIGLWQAARDYQPDKGTTFPTFAYMVIRRHLTACVVAANRGKQQPLTQAVRDDNNLPHLHQVSDLCERTEEIRDLLQRIAALPEFERRCVLGIASGLSYHEIDGNTKRVDNALASARRRLRMVA